MQAIDNAAFTPLTDALENIVNSKAELAFDTTSFNIDNLISSSNTCDYTYYSGSLTTPTCNEVVEWINFLTPLKISATQLALFRFDQKLILVLQKIDHTFRKLMDGKGKEIVDNFRPPQPLNGRTVQRFTQ